MNGLLEQKLTDEDLLRLAKGEDGGSLSVIIELELPPQVVEFSDKDTSSPARPRPHRIRSYSPQQEKEIEARTVEAEAFLRRSLAKNPVPLRAARAFAADVTGEELRVVASSPLVKAVRLNRVLK